MSNDTVEIPTKRICVCGCGRTLAPTAGKKSIYIRGHAYRLGNPGERHYLPKPDEIPNGLCECGCGGQTTIAGYTSRIRRVFKGHPVPRLPGHGSASVTKGPASHKWKGGRSEDRLGYVRLYAPDHPHRDHYGYVKEHRAVMEEVLGRYLEPGEEVHHRNGTKNDNRPENLELWKRRQPRGVRAADYHCAGCRCAELT